jgi:RND family efflux transporter MFP subunit
MKRTYSIKNSCFRQKTALASFLFILVSIFPTMVTGEEKEKKATPVKVDKIIKKTVRPFTTLIGTAEPYRKSTVASEIPGLVIDFSVRVGQRVKKGDLLASVETRPLSLDLQQAEASLAEANENYKNALSELKRTEELFKKKTISSRRYDVALYTANAMKQRILALETRIAAIKYDIEKCLIKAPFSGFVVEEHTQVGQWLEKGGEVATIVDMDPILITVPVPDRYIRFVRPGQTVDLNFEFMARNEKRKGSVRDVIPTGNEKARTFPVQIKVANSDFSILAGMSSGVRFPVGQPQSSLLVNKDAIITKGNEHHIFIVNDKKSHLIPVAKGPAYGSYVVVEGKISEGQLAIVEGNERIQPGEDVRILEPSDKK